MRYLAFNTHDVSGACLLSKYRVTAHARQRLGERKIYASDLISAMRDYCEILEHYTNRVPWGPAALVLTRLPYERWVHVVCAYDDQGMLYLLTAYEPTPPKWVDERNRGSGERDDE